MSDLTFCPKCGTPNLQFLQERKWECTSCGFVLYHNVAAAVAVLITWGEELFLTRRNIDPAKGLLDLPGGFIDPDETAEEACARELQEELGVSIAPDKLLYVGSQPNIYPYKEITYRTMDLFFRYAIDEKIDFKMDTSELADTLWLPMSSLNLSEIAFASQRVFLEKFLKEKC